MSCSITQLTNVLTHDTNYKLNYPGGDRIGTPELCTLK